MYAMALGLGLGCGFGCGSLSSPFLTSYIVGKDLDVKTGFKSLFIFSIGKIISMVILAILVSLLAFNFITEETMILGIKLTSLFNIFMVIMGIMIVKMSINVIKKNKECSCNKSCDVNVIDEINHDIKMDNKEESKRDLIMLFGGGFIYGLTPCLPLITILGICATLSIVSSAMFMLFFAIITCLSPVLLNTVVSGVVNKTMRNELKSDAAYIHVLVGMFLVFFGFIPFIL